MDPNEQVLDDAITSLEATVTLLSISTQTVDTTVDNLQAAIVSLQAQIAELQAQGILTLTDEADRLFAIVNSLNGLSTSIDNAVV